MKEDLSYRPLEPGMGEAVAARTILRPVGDRRETWGEVADRVALGNVMLQTGRADVETTAEYARLRDHIAFGRVLMSGRHLQHGDSSQPRRNLEMLANCSTAAASFIKFYLLLNGSGVGRSYDDALMVVDWDFMPELVCALDADHPDYEDRFMTPDEAIRRLRKEGRTITYYLVPDSREGWAKAVEIMERMAFERTHKDSVLLLDFSKVRPKGSPIGGMQNRPASGPIPLMDALLACHAVKGQGMEPWEQAMRIDHELAACVAVGGARRAARIAIKNWRDPGIFKFIDIKEQGGLWSANNSIAVDAEFWSAVESAYAKLASDEFAVRLTDDEMQALRVFEAATKAQYEHGTGEPGFINIDRLNTNEEGLERYADGKFTHGFKYRVDPMTEQVLLKKVYEGLLRSRYKFVVNPCGEVVLLATGGYCVIADVVPFFADDLDQARDAFLAATRALIRTNRMQSLYQKEVERTNRIGVGMTGIQEFAWKFFGLTFRDLIADFDLLINIPDHCDVCGLAECSYCRPFGEAEEPKAWKFWRWLRETRKAVEAEADRYSDELGVTRPHTVTTIKPAGTTSKLFLLTEGAHLPARTEFLRWVQFQKGDPLIAEYEAKGYPTQEVEQYPDVVMVGFPTQPMICRLGIPRERLVTASEATMEEQYKWVQLLEKFWLGPRGNQISYTLKYDREAVSLGEYRDIIRKNQPHVRAISVMPASDWRKTKEVYGYVPEEPISLEEFQAIEARIAERAEETISLEDLRCEAGACPL